MVKNCLRLCFLMFLLFLFAGSAHAQAVLGNSCPASGQNAITANGTPVICTGSPLVWTAVGAVGGGLTSVSSLPATCTPGVTQPVTLTVAPFGVYQCGPNVNQWYPLNAQRAFSPLAYGAKWDVKFTYAMVATSGSQLVTCPDCNFTAADQGKLAEGNASPYDSNHGTSLYATVFAPGKICNNGFLTSTTVNMCASDGVTANNAAANCTPLNASATMCTFAWGSADDTTAINSAASAAWTTGGFCGAVQLPAGAAFFSSQILAFSNTAISLACGGQTSAGNIISGVDSNQTGAEVYGQGPGNTILIPYNFNFTSCSGPDASAGDCIGGTDNMEAHDFGVNGLGMNFNTAGANGKTLFELRGSNNGGVCTGSTGFNLTMANWAVNTTAIGLAMGLNACGDPTYTNIVSELFGGENCLVTNSSTVTTVSGLACFGATIEPIVFKPSSNANGAAGMINSYGGYYGEEMVPGTVWLVSTVAANGILNSYGDFIVSTAPLAGTSTITVNSGNGAVTINLNGSSVAMNSGDTGTSTLLNFNNQTFMHSRGSTFVWTGASNRLIGNSTTSTFFDEGGNTYTPGSLASAIQAGGFVANNGVKGICTGTATSSSTLALNITGLSTTGTGITTACTSTTIDKGLAVQGARTVQNLFCSSSATTVSVACTVLKNGVATTITCTMTAATTCNDTVHTVSAVDGDLISYQIVTGAAETGANIHAVAGLN